MSVRVSVLVSTLDEGIFRVGAVLLPPRPDVSYVVVHQHRDRRFLQRPEALERPDVMVIHDARTGLSRSRNLAIAAAAGTIGLLADDDVRYREEYLDRVRHVFECDASLDVAFFRIRTPDGEPPYKEYGTREVRVSSRFPVSSIEIAFRADRLLELGVAFDERFGLGSCTLVGGEENVFLADCLRAGLHVRYFPYDVVEHPYESGGRTLSMYHPLRNRVTGATDARINGVVAIVKAFGGMLRHRAALEREGRSPTAYLQERLGGALYVLRTGGPRHGRADVVEVAAAPGSPDVHSPMQDLTPDSHSSSLRDADDA